MTTQPKESEPTPTKEDRALVFAIRVGTAPTDPDAFTAEEAWKLVAAHRAAACRAAVEEAVKPLVEALTKAEIGLYTLKNDAQLPEWARTHLGRHWELVRQAIDAHRSRQQKEGRQ